MSSGGRVAVGGLTTVRTIGGLIPADLLARIVTGTDLPGLTADDYRLELGVTPREAANRAWSVLTGAWTAYREALAKRPEGDRATGLTRDKWLSVLLRELGFGRVPPTPAGGIQADGRTFPVSHEWGEVPIHLLGWGVDLDRKTSGVPGAAERAPHAMVQELLNRSDEHLWAILANGGTFRMLRDSSSLVGQSYVEFDLEAIFDGEIFSDFAVMFLLCHQTRFEPVDPEAGAEDCWLERWRTDAVETGARALGSLRVGVQRAIEALGTGFLRHPANTELRRCVDSYELTLADYHRALLRLVYRLLFCFVAEDRDLLLDPDAEPTSRRRYTEWFSTARLRRVALRRRGTRHSDLWQALSVVLEGLGREGGRPELALPALGGLFENGPVDVVLGAELGNDALLEALRHLCVIQPPGGGPKRTVDYRNLGAEELGGIYESLLEFVPRYDPVDRAFTLESLVGNERKTSGAYYTPTSLIDCLLDSALDPLLDDAEAATEPEEALLDLTVCDPACGSGHFLVAAARRIAARVARVRSNGGEPTVLETQAAMHDVVAKCIYGVDLNPMAAELAKVSLWLEALQPGRPLSFLDAHIKVGNALIGATPALLAQGIPDEAFTALEGDDKRTVTSLRKRNRAERGGQGNLFAAAGVSVDNEQFALAVSEVDALQGLTLADVHLAEHRQRELELSPELQRARLVADAWCAAFVVKKSPTHRALTQATWDGWRREGRHHDRSDELMDEVERLSAKFRFFHWHLEFPTILRAGGARSATSPSGWDGGFSCVLGNPPWERIKLQEQEWFAARDPVIGATSNGAARRRLISGLADSSPALLAEYNEARRTADAEGQLARLTGRFPLTGRGDVNTYALFAELDRSVLSARGRMGVVLPAGIATDVTSQRFFGAVVQSRELVSMRHFENESLVFPNVHHAFRFVLFTIAGRAVTVERATYSFYARSVSDLSRQDAQLELSADDIALLSPNTGTCPIFRAARDAALVLDIAHRVPVLVRDDGDLSPWAAYYLRLIHYDDHSDLLDAEPVGPDSLRVYESKMIHQFNHRWGDWADRIGESDFTNLPNVPADRLLDPTYQVQPRYWVKDEDFRSIVDKYPHKREWFLAYRDVVRSTDQRTVIAAAIPYGPASVNLPVLGTAVSDGPAVLLAVMNSFVVDYLARNAVGGIHLTFGIVKQLLIPGPAVFNEVPLWSDCSLREWIERRALELTYTSWDIAGFARDLGDFGAPFVWDGDRRPIIRAELDAAVMHLYGLTRAEAEFILDTFPIVHRTDVSVHGEERTRRLTLECYDAMDAAAIQGIPFRSDLDPSPGHGPRHAAR